LFLKAKQNSENKWIANATCRFINEDNSEPISASTLNSRAAIVYCELYFVIKTKNNMASAYWSVNIKCVLLKRQILYWLKESQVLTKPASDVEQMLEEYKTDKEFDDFFTSSIDVKEKPKPVVIDEGIAQSPAKKSPKKNKLDTDFTVSKKFKRVKNV